MTDYAIESTLHLRCTCPFTKKINWFIDEIRFSCIVTVRSQKPARKLNSFFHLPCLVCVINTYEMGTKLFPMMECSSVKSDACTKYLNLLLLYTSSPLWFVLYFLLHHIHYITLISGYFAASQPVLNQSVQL